MVTYRFGSPVVVVLAATVLGSFGTDSHQTALAAAQQSINAQVYAPLQAIVFDGSAEASRTFLVALSRAGFLTQFLKTPFAPCDQVIHQAQWATHSLDVPGRGISIPGAFHFDFDVFPRPPGPSVSPFNPAVLETDCDVLADFTAVQKYLPDVEVKAEQAQSQIDECLNNVRALHCQIAGAVENAAVIPDAGIGVDTAGFDDPLETGRTVAAGERIGPDCARCAEALRQLPQRLDSLELELLTCSAQFGRQSDILNWINLAISPSSEGGQGV
jgi:hypothetical protein